jgi:hypothetical protein
MPPKRKRTRQIGFRLTEEEAALILEAQAKSGLYLRELILRLVRAFLEGSELQEP